MEELVFGVDEKYLLGLTFREDLVGLDMEYFFHILKTGYFRKRSEVEGDPSFKQIIPYTVLVSGDEDTFWSYTRAGNESRLHDLVSVGIGGHINFEDFDQEGEFMILNNMWREIDEEVTIFDDAGEGIDPVELNISAPLALIYDDSASVHSDHVGIFHFAFLPKGSSVVMNNEGKEGRFRSYWELQSTENLETWSKVVFPFLG